MKIRNLPWACLRGERPVQTSLNRSFIGPQIPRLWRTEDRTAVFGPLRSWEFAVLIGLGPVQSRSFSGYKTGLPNTSCSRSCCIVVCWSQPTCHLWSSHRPVTRPNGYGNITGENIVTHTRTCDPRVAPAPVTARDPNPWHSLQSDDDTATSSMSKTINNTAVLPEATPTSLQPFSESAIMAAIWNIAQPGHLESSSRKRRQERETGDDLQPKKRGKMVVPPRKLSVKLGFTRWLSKPKSRVWPVI